MTVAECIEIVRRVRDGFLSEEYATDQPLSSFNERFACNQVIAALEAASGMEAPSGGETVEQGSTEGDSPVAESETPPPSDLSTDKDG